MFTSINVPFSFASFFVNRDFLLHSDRPIQGGRAEQFWAHFPTNLKNHNSKACNTGQWSLIGTRSEKVRALGGTVIKPKPWLLQEESKSFFWGTGWLWTVRTLLATIDDWQWLTTKMASRSLLSLSAIFPLLLMLSLSPLSSLLFPIITMYLILYSLSLHIIAIISMLWSVVIVYDISILIITIIAIAAKIILFRKTVIYHKSMLLSL